MRGEQHGSSRPSIEQAEVAGMVCERFLFPTEGHAYAFVGYTDYCLTNWELGDGQHFYIVWQGETRIGQVRSGNPESLWGGG
jgi:hypothetical protein